MLPEYEQLSEERIAWRTEQERLGSNVSRCCGWSLDVAYSVNTRFGRCELSASPRPEKPIGKGSGGLPPITTLIGSSCGCWKRRIARLVHSNGEFWAHLSRPHSMVEAGEI